MRRLLDQRQRRQPDRHRAPGAARVGPARAALQAQLNTVVARLHRITKTTAPDLVAIQGIGPDVASTLLVTTGDNPHRLHSRASFAALCGFLPLPATSGKKQNRHRLNRGGDRHANAALWRIAIVRLSHDSRTRDYLAKRTSEGKNTGEILRCLKRYIAREVFTALPRELVEREPEQAAA